MIRIAFGSLAAACLSASAAGQATGNEWVEYIRTDSMLGPSATAISNGATEVDFDFADLDKDGWTDLVVVRKEPVTTAGKRTNILLMNENGVLQDRTALFATASLSAGDQGFLTPTNDRDVVIADLDNDTWLDLVTATTLSDGDSKRIGHPRIYMNLGNDAGGNWQGFRHEDARIPQLLVSGNPANPRFCSVAARDITGDGFVDLYFGDYDSGPQPHPDMNDRLLVNAGAANPGFFTDQSNTRMTLQMLESAFGMAAVIEDMNLDGVLDIVKDSALNAPQRVSVSLNDPDNEGFFDLFTVAATNQPYHVNVGDLNNDGLPDMVVTDDAQDFIQYNTGSDIFGRPIWSSDLTFQFAGGGMDDGFGGNNYIVDLDNDGWNDIIIADVDVDIAGCGRRTHIYHNPGGAVGSQIRPVEERASNSSWLGVVGMGDNDLEGTHDVAVFDIDRDGGLDMVFGRCTGTFVWRQDFEVPPSGGLGDLGGSTLPSTPPRRGKGTAGRFGF